MYTEGIKSDLTEEDIKEAINWGPKITKCPESFLRLYRFGSVRAYKEWGDIGTNFSSLAWLGWEEAQSHRSLKRTEIDKIAHSEDFTISITTYGHRPDFAENYRIVLKQGEKVIQPKYIVPTYEANPTSAFPEPPSYKAMVTAFFSYSEIDPKAKTTIVLTKDERESRFRVDFSRYK